MVTIEELKKQIEEAKEIYDNNPSEFWGKLPRVSYRELPGELQEEAEKIRSHNLKDAIFSYYPIEALGELVKDPEQLEQLIEDAFYYSKFEVSSIDPIRISLYAKDFIEAWEDTLISNKVAYSKKKYRTRGNISEYEILDTSDLPNLLPTSKKFINAITPLKDENAYIMPFNYQQISFDVNEEGELIINTKEQYNALEQAKAMKFMQAKGIDQPLLRQLFSACMKAFLCNYGNSITVYLPSFAKEMGIDVFYANLKAGAQNTKERLIIPKHNSNNFFNKLEALENLSGVWKGSSFYRVFVLESYDANENTLTFSSPWFFKMAREMLLDPITGTKGNKSKSILWEITGLSYLQKSNIVSAKSKATVEIIGTLIAGLQQRGNIPDAKLHPRKKCKDPELIVYEISFSTLIQRIPLVMESLNNATDSNKTTLLQRYFCGKDYKTRLKEGNGTILEEYIKKYTYITEYYKDFTIKFNPPTFKTLTDKIVITHKGINGSFTFNNSLNALVKDHLQKVGEV